ncbi:hypothetical protein B0A50_08415 [Salinomyces thailandicus]|uniref:Lysine-specific metallo-endopeptidase domain-containing protein n=1 Tax=Salinomyces thailandicus TaxID=706561 RepID=A0A4U0TJL8_9PEZI|nr:hypothetical protein B0A50_08415 [Salinomyces thailandica]
MIFHDVAMLSSIVLLYCGSSYALPANTNHNNAKRADPHIMSGKLWKRTDPTIGNGIDTSDPLRGGKLISAEGTTDGAFSQAKEMMNYAVTLPAASVDSIFNKYFNPGDKNTVLAVFNRLLGDGQQDGAAALANINVIGDNDLPAGDPAPAYLEGFDDPDPILGLTDDAFVYPNRDDFDDACATWADEGMAQDMYLLGSILLHEYTHWDWFLGSIHNGAVIDQSGGYGWEGARALDKSLAVYNADSYGWFATELLWATLCAVDGGYNDPHVEKRSE